MRTCCFALVVVMVGGCVPSAEEIGSTAAVATPAAHLVALVLLAILYKLWRRGRPGLRLDWRVQGAALAGMAGAAMASARSADVGLLAFVAVVYGTAYVAATLVGWRIWLWRHAPSAGRLGALVGALLLYVPTLAFATGLFGGSDVALVFAYGWFWIGGYGAVGMVIFVALALEALVRSRRTASPMSSSAM